MSGYSKEWVDLMQKEEAFRKAVGHYNLKVSAEIHKKDIEQALNDRKHRLIVTRLMSEGYFPPETIEQVWEQLVYLVFYGDMSTSAWSVSALQKMSYTKQQLYCDEISRLALVYADKEKHDDIALMFGLQLLYKLGNKETLKQYIEKFKEYLDLSEADINHYLK